MTNYDQKKTKLIAAWHHDTGQLRLAKSTISNLFRYEMRDASKQRLSLGNFNEIISLDSDRMSLEVEGLTTFETIVDYTLAHGYLPLVSPELKHITIGGAIVGIGIESTCFRHGFVHDSLLEADVVLPGGNIVTCSANNEYADLFNALPNSYGTLGYLLRAKIKLQPALPYVHLTINRYAATNKYLDAMHAATEAADVDFVEGLFFEDRRFYLMVGRFRRKLPQLDDILRENIFYKLVQRRTDIYLTTADYLFRYDPEWFWNIPGTLPYRLFRRYAPKRMRNSSFYTKYSAKKNSVIQLLTGSTPSATEPLIQDWEVPWRNAGELIRFCLENVKLNGLPWAAVPIQTPQQPTLYPIEPGEPYFNLGCYCQVTKPQDREPYYYTKIMDKKCFNLGGIKMLYSSTFINESEFEIRYNGAAYRQLKRKYDPEGRAQTLYAKVARAPE